ncbi:MAG: hypothetical protein JWO00_99 [Candidatus Parcubacteria bacterium]|nr:hypothetical protein [Candidatus Parcubacteria bacterium]
MNHTSPIRYGMLLVSLGALVLSIGLYAYFYHDTLTLTSRAVAARDAAAGEGDRENQGKAIKALASTTADSRARLATLFVPADDAVSFIQDMESIGRTSGATVSIASIGENSTASAAKGSVGSINAHITVAGPWSSVMNAVELFEVLPYKIRIDRLILNTSIEAADRSKPAARSWQASFDISAATII